MEITREQYEELMKEIKELKQLTIRNINEKVAKELMDIVEVDRNQKLDFAKKFKPFELDALEKEANRISNDFTKPESTKEVIKKMKEETKKQNESFYNATFYAE